MVVTLGYEHPASKAKRFIMVRPSLRTSGYDVLQWGSGASEHTGRYDSEWPYKDEETACKSALKTARYLRNSGWQAI